MALKRYTFWIDEAQADALKAIKARDGVPEAEQLRRALNAWIESKGVSQKAERKRGATRRRS